ncbi:2-octaprenyl-6-methoxyphenyl hydroxylase [Thiocapsa imhoffii]|uniref:2-octaprenyl-6-methoxyphenyl hydroxylase n=1 Tax=Thiocapsa imhoffii TaxID=382777 RepID=A0A9X0WFA9_9GAMM|nr:2-octaprenyl-6-methoxyphenyl hydroxylase [Thiocapsa imhoffii]MBK1643481.1 2-octaprenyl-6-methoxyphenyl hydroxylase [Thiocapsa imhoffii]
MLEYDLAIVGGGLVGGSLASALSGSGLRVLVVEAVPTGAAHQPSYDERVIALSWGSRRIFEAIGLWSAMAPDAEPIRQVHVSDRGHCAFTRINQSDGDVGSLGYVVPARVIGQAIGVQLADAPEIELLSPARLLDHRVTPGQVELHIDGAAGPLTVRTRLLVAADGGDSAVRQRLDLKMDETRYDQDALITTVSVDRPRPGVAFERFTESGPLALLPMTEGRYSVVWTCQRDDTDRLLALTDETFLKALQERFGYRLGRFTQAAPRRAYPLMLRLTRNPVQPRVVLIGNAAHTLHPVAGQGFNLGLRDVAALAGVVTQCARAGADLGGPAALADYRAWRGRDQFATARLTDLLARVFINPWPPLRLARGAAMLGVDLIPPARRRLAQRFMGVSGRLPRLACGVPLEKADV